MLEKYMSETNPLFLHTVLRLIFNSKRLISSAGKTKIESRQASAGMDSWDRYTVFLVEEVHEVCHRVATGWVYKELVFRGYPPGPQWEEVVLY